MTTRLYSINKLSEYYGLAPDTLRKLFASGRIAAEKIGGKWYTTKDAVEQYIERERVNES